MEQPVGLVEARIRALIEKIERAKPGPLKTMLGDDASVLTEIFVNRNLDEWVFDHQDLEDVDFSGSSLLGTSFRGARLRGARFDRAWVERWRLYEARDWTQHVLDWRRLAVQSTAVPHRFRQRFSEAPFAPELVMLPPRKSTAEFPMDSDEAEALAEGRVAIAALPVTQAQIAFYEFRAKGLRDYWSDDQKDRPCALRDVAPQAYIDWLKHAVGGDYRIPSGGLWEYAARAGSIADYPWGPVFDPTRAITSESADGRERPTPVDTRERPGEGRCNAFGLFDVVGNLREVTREIDPSGGAERLCLRGGSYRQGADRARLSFRWKSHPDALRNYNDIGLRVIRVFPREPRV